MTEDQSVANFLNWLDRRLATLALINDPKHRAEAVETAIASARERLQVFSTEERARIMTELNDWLESAQMVEASDSATAEGDAVRDVLEELIDVLG